MNGGHTLSPLARADIEDVWAYTEERWGRSQAERYLRQLQAVIETVAANPRRGRACDEVRPGYFKIPADSHIIFYRLIANQVDIVRILHERMDYGRRL